MCRSIGFLKYRQHR